MLLERLEAGGVPLTRVSISGDLLAQLAFGGHPVVQRIARVPALQVDVVRTDGDVLVRNVERGLDRAVAAEPGLVGRWADREDVELPRRTEPDPADRGAG